MDQTALELRVGDPLDDAEDAVVMLTVDWVSISCSAGISLMTFESLFDLANGAFFIFWLLADRWHVKWGSLPGGCQCAVWGFPQ